MSKSSHRIVSLSAAALALALTTFLPSPISPTAAMDLAAAKAATGTAPAPASASADPVYAASFKDFERRPQPLAQWKDRFMVVYFWATWCKSCRAEIPELIALHDKYQDKGVAVIGISIDNTDKVKAFAKEFAIPYPLLIGSQDAMDLSKQLGNNVGGLPFTLMINNRGEIVKTILGELPHGQLEEILVSLMG